MFLLYAGTAIYYALANAGFAVIAFDAVGFGTRGYEFNGAAGGAQGGDGTPLFYRRFPHWSLLGKIVHDGLAALDLATTGAAAEQAVKAVKVAKVAKAVNAAQIDAVSVSEASDELPDELSDELSGMSAPMYPGHDPPLALPPMDPDRVFAVGYDVGGRAALYMGAIDPVNPLGRKRLRGVVRHKGVIKER